MENFITVTKSLSDSIAHQLHIKADVFPYVHVFVSLKRRSCNKNHHTLGTVATHRWKSHSHLFWKRITKICHHMQIGN